LPSATAVEISSDAAARNWAIREMAGLGLDDQCLAEFPLGQALCVANLTDCRDMTEADEHLALCSTEAGTDPIGISFLNCKFTGGYENYRASTDGLYFDDCFLGLCANQQVVNLLAGAYTQAINCVGIAGSEKSHFACSGIVKIQNNILIDGGRLLLATGATTNCLLIGNTVYGLDLEVVRFNDTQNHMLTMYNNIFDLLAQADYVINYSNSNSRGTVVYNDFNCIYSSVGAGVITNFANVVPGTVITPVIGQNSIEADPQFVDAAGDDFRPRNINVLRGGKPDAEGNPTQMGAVLQKYQFAASGRMANLGRLGIFR